MLLWDDDISVVCGNVVVFDMQGLTFGHIAQCTPSITKYEFKALPLALINISDQFHSKQKAGIFITGRVPYPTEKHSFDQFASYI